MERHLLAAMILSGGLAASFFQKMAREGMWKFALLLSALAAAVWLALMPDVRFSYAHPKPPDPWILLGKEMARERAKYGTVVTFPAGKIPFFAGGDFIDEPGLNDPTLAAMRRERFIPGHAAGSHKEAMRLARERGGLFSTFAFSFQLTPENIADVLLWVENTDPRRGVFHAPDAAQQRALLSNRAPFADTLILRGR